MRSDAGERECRAGAVLIHPAGATHSDRFGGGEARLLIETIGLDLSAGRGWHYSIAAYASVQKSLNTLGGSGESSMRWVRRMPIIRFSGSV